MDVTRLLAGLTASQREAVTTTAAPLRIIAGAGSGKTRVLTRRIAYRCESEGIDPRHVLALTFTRKAAGELGERLRGLGLRDQITSGTFHAVAFAALRGAWADQRRTPPELIERKARLVGELLEQRSRTSLPTLTVVQEIEWAKARLVPPAGYAAAAAGDERLGARDAAAVADVYAAYEAAKRRRNVVDFDDLLAQCAELVEHDGTFGAAQRWRHRHLFVDEFQDVNPLQHALLRGWLGASRDLCVVGDPDQAIYGWNGADARFILDFEEEFPGAATVVLEDNFRSTPEIIEASRSVLRAGRLPEAHRPSGSAPTIVRFADDDAEAAGVARSVRDHHRPGGSWSEQAVLARTNAQLGAIERALRQAGVPTMTGVGARLVDRPEVKAVLRRLRAGGLPVAAVLEDVEEELRAEADDEVRAGLSELLVLGREFMATAGPRGSEPGELAGWLQSLSPRERPGGRAAAVELTTFHAAKGLEWRVVHIVGVEKGFVPIGHAKRPEQIDEERRLLHVAMSRAADELLLSWAGARRFGDKVVERQRSPLLGAMMRRGDTGPVDVAGGTRSGGQQGAVGAGAPAGSGAVAVAGAGAGGGVERGEDGFSASEGLSLVRSTLAEVDAGVMGGPGGPAETLERQSTPKEAEGAEGAAGAGARTISASERRTEKWSAEDARRLFDALVAWRDGRARAVNTTPGAVLSDTVLQDIVARRPRSVDELAAVPTMGAIRARRLGPELIEIIGTHDEVGGGGEG